MRVLIDATAVSREKAGVGVYALELVRALLELPGAHYFLVVQSDDRDFDYSHRPNVTVIRVPARIMRKPPVRLAFEQTVLPLLLRRYRIGVVHSLHYSFPLLRFGAKSVVTIHDMTSFSMPEVHLRFKRAYYRFYIRAAGRLANALIFVSQSAQRDFVLRFGGPRGLSRVVHHGRRRELAPCTPGTQELAEATAGIRGRYDLPERFVLYIGMIEPRKNLTRLVQAFAKLIDRFPDVGLVIAGTKGWLCEDLFDTVQRLGLQARVRFPGFVAERDKRALLCAAEVFAYVSLYEGFGLPVLEALSCGVPTLTSNTSSLPEVVGEAALTVDPLDVDLIQEKLERLLEDSALRDRLKRDAPPQAARFTWERTAQLTLKTYRDVAASGGSLPEQVDA